MADIEQHETRDGRIYWVVSLDTLRRIPGWHCKGQHTWRGPCPFHGGDNRTGCTASLVTGAIGCFTHGCWGRIAEHPETRAGKGTHVERTLPTWTPPPPKPPPPFLASVRARAAWQQLLPRATEALAWWEARRIPAALLVEGGAGWCPGDAARAGRGATGDPWWLSGRVTFTVTDANGTPCQLYGRRIDEGPIKWLGTDESGGPRYYGLDVAIDSNEPLVVVESIGNVLALRAAGVRGAFSVLGTTGFSTLPWERLAGRDVIVLGDRDVPGTKAMIAALEAAPAWIRIAPAASPEFEEGTDVADWWRTHGTLPNILVERLRGW